MNLYAASPLLWVSRCVKLWDAKAGREEIFRPYDYQAEILADHSSQRLVTKARQIGISTIIAVEALHTAIFQPKSLILFVSRNEDAAIHLLSYCYRAFHSLEEPQALIRDNQTEMLFSNGSHIMSLPATPATGRGFDAIRVYWDELAHCQPQALADEIYRAVVPTVARGGKLTFVSTPKGTTNLFARLWHEGQNWSKHFIPWHRCPVYTADWHEQEHSKFTDDQWASEYECDFVSSAGVSPFDAERLRAMLSDCRPPMEGEGELKIWKKPIAARTYTAGVDVGYGVGGSYSGCAIVDWQTGEHVADLHGQIAPDQLSIRSVKLCQEYNDALLVVEANGPGLRVLEIVKELRYSHLLHKDEHGKREIPGLWLDQKTRQAEVLEFAEAIKEGSFISYDRELISELMTFVYDDVGKAKAAEGCYDDRVMKTMHAWHGRKYTISFQTRPEELIFMRRSGKVGR